MQHGNNAGRLHTCSHPLLTPPVEVVDGLINLETENPDFRVEGVIGRCLLSVMLNRIVSSVAAGSSGWGMAGLAAIIVSRLESLRGVAGTSKLLTVSDERTSSMVMMLGLIFVFPRRSVSLDGGEEGFRVGDDGTEYRRTSSVDGEEALDHSLGATSFQL